MLDTSRYTSQFGCKFSSTNSFLNSQGAQPGLIIMDHEIIKTVLVKDFSHFVDHGFEVILIQFLLKPNNALMQFKI
jgi:hypothetical protein